MKAGTIFEHPTKDGGVVRLKAVKEANKDDGCEGFYFNGGRECYAPQSYTCAVDEIIYVESEPQYKLPRIMERIKHRTGITELDVLESEIAKILEE